jgi:arylsulfatase A
MHLQAEEVTIAEMLKTKNYQTAHFGKWHLTAEGMGQPLMNDQGYDYSFFTYNNANPSHENPVNFFRNGEPVGELIGYAAHLVVDEALQWLEEKKSSENPFYINVWFNEPHEKVAAPDSLANRHEYNKEYYGCIENMDYAVGRITKFLKANNLEESTIVIFTSDNGSQVYGSNHPLRGAKGFNYEGGVRVPFIIKWPGQVPTGTTSDYIGSFTDVLPSIAGFCEVTLPENRTLDGNDLTSVFKGDYKEIERQHPVFFYRYFNDPVCMLRDGDWCLLGYETTIPFAERLDIREYAKFKPQPGEPRWAQWGFQESHMENIPEIVPTHFELYNLKNDIGQENDLASEHPDKVAAMKTQMLQLREEMINEGGDWYDENF